MAQKVCKIEFIEEKTRMSEPSDGNESIVATDGSELDETFYSKKDKSTRHKLSVLFGILQIFFVAIFIISVSISLPILFRPFYYWQIDALGIADSGFSKTESINAFNAMMDYCVWGKKVPEIDGQLYFGTLECSREGLSHFIDVRRLFVLDLVLLGISFVYVVTIKALQYFGILERVKFWKRTPAFFSSGFIFLFLIHLIIIVPIDFEKSFVVFHKIFFPGKSNWIFDDAADEIINILPQQFFINCAILIGVAIIVISGLVVLVDYLHLRKCKKKDADKLQS